MQRVTIGVTSLLLLNLCWYIHTSMDKTRLQPRSNRLRLIRGANELDPHESGVSMSNEEIRSAAASSADSTRLSFTQTHSTTSASQAQDDYTDMFKSMIAIPMMTTYMKNQTNVMVQRSRLVNEQLARYKLKSRFITGMSC